MSNRAEAVGCDPVYAGTQDGVFARARSDIEICIDNLRSVRDEYPTLDIDGFRRAKLEALERFARDFAAPAARERYFPAALPKLPFADRSFDLVLSAHLLFCYAAPWPPRDGPRKADFAEPTGLRACSPRPPYRAPVAAPSKGGRERRFSLDLRAAGRVRSAATREDLMRQARLVTFTAGLALLLALAFAQSARAGVFEPLEVSKLSIALNFAKADKDRVALTGLLPLGADFAAEGSTAVIDVGGVVRSFTLDAKGKSKVGDDRVAVTAVKKRGVVLGWKLTLSIAKANLAADLADEGLTNATVKNEPRSVTVTASVAGKIYTQTTVLTYKAKQGKTGSAKK